MSYHRNRNIEFHRFDWYSWVMCRLKIMSFQHYTDEITRIKYFLSVSK